MASIDQVQEALRQELLIVERNLATSIFLALKLCKPLLVEGEAGVGKTELDLDVLFADPRKDSGACTHQG